MCVFQAVPEFGPGKCERNSSQQPGKVCKVFSPENGVKNTGLDSGFVLSMYQLLIFSCSIHSHRFAYKDEYEKFKLYMTIILMFGAITCLFFLNYRWENPLRSRVSLLINIVGDLLKSQRLARWFYFIFFSVLFRVTDEIFNFLLVWYYCTLTIRESILMSNGSRCALVPIFLSMTGFVLAESLCHTVLCSSSAFQDQRLVGVSPLCIHLSVRGDAYLVSFCLFWFHSITLFRRSFWSIIQTGAATVSSSNIVSFHRPEGPMYQMFRSQFLAFSIYQSKNWTCLLDLE